MRWLLLLLCVVWASRGTSANNHTNQPHSHDFMELSNTFTNGSDHNDSNNDPWDVFESDYNITHNMTEDEGEHEKLEQYPVAVIDFERVQTPFIIGLWIFCACLGKIGFHMTPKLSHVFPESCMLIVLGVIIGLLLFYTQAASVSPLTADVFFLYLLPPIILDAGYFMPNRLFFDHLFTILVFAVIGTIWNVLTIGISMYAISLTGLFGMKIPMLHMFLFSSLISAVDPVAVLAVFEEIHVEEVLYILVFGESLLNDGVTVVLYHLFEGFSELGEENIKAVDIASGILSFLLVALGGTAIGIIWGFLTAFVTRFTSQVRVIEPIFVFVMAYLAYLNAEIFHLSGILAITFCGITMKNYVEQNISTKSHTTIKYAMKMLASSSETIIFMFLGVSTVQSKHDWNTWFVVLTIVFCSIYRILGVLIFSAMCNRFRVKKISFVDKFVMSYGGLRGAVAFALVITIDITHIPLQPMFLTATIAMVYFTVFVQGITIKPLVQLLGVKKAEKRKVTMNERLHERTMDYIVAGIEDVMGKHGNIRLRNKFKRFNNKYLTPFLVRDKNLIEPKFLETITQIRMQEAFEYMASNGVSQNNIESFANLLRSAATHPHMSKNAHGEWNLDVGELEYNPTQRDMNEAKFHHLLANDQTPTKRRGSTYKRHAVRDDEMQTISDVTHHNMQLYSRQITNSVRKINRKAKKQGFEHHHHHHRHQPIPEHASTSQGENIELRDGDPEVSLNQTGNGVVKNQSQDDVRAAYQKNGSAIKLKNDHLAHILRDNPAFEDDDGVMAGDEPPITTKRQSIRGPTMAESALPWKRYTEGDTPASGRIIQRSMSILTDLGDNSAPTVAEAMLPWKRPEDLEMCERPVLQSEFPPWANNKEYVNYYSPSNTFLGKIGTESYPNIREIFARRNSSSSLGSRRSSLKENPLALKERTPSQGSIDLPGHSSQHHPEATPATHHNSQMRKRSSSTGENLLNTTIAEEGRPYDTVIVMNPDGGESQENTHM